MLISSSKKLKVKMDIKISFISLKQSDCVNYPRANGRKPGARVTNSALAFTYIRIMRFYIAQWHSGMKSRPRAIFFVMDVGRSF